ncbi:hypothetical protein F0562_021365 [Nyssa sinensis]|uniref:Spermatogenesis-associated protein 20-like TRX domain-containing protein n=1 Tax=Nyssa sinensis TaxID=561372 RepID=A0A5J5BLP6_9ASTE|nr:hypothetical protein F0562_021365 [Nyssa sinensis]
MSITVAVAPLPLDFFPIHPTLGSPRGSIDSSSSLTDFPIALMAFSLQPSLAPRLLINHLSTKSSSVSSISLHNSMLKRLVASCSVRRFLTSHNKSARKSSYFLVPSLSWPFSVTSRRPIHSLKVLAMAEQTQAPAAQSHKHSNRLAAEHSPYLLQHAHNPVNWYAWGEEAFQEARRRDVPIFLSIGYSTCHWCHVMEVESFEDEGVAKLLNDWFVSIKVDREERPDVDKVYMTYVQALYGGGGWPLSVFLSPDLKPLMGGTYFPPDDNFGRPGFKTVLRKVKEAWDSKRDVLIKSGAFAIEQLSEALSASASSNKLQDGLSQAALRLCAEQLAGSYDSVFGGFGSAPKFPRPVEIQLMLYQSKRLEEIGKSGEEIGKSGEAKEGLKMVLFNLQCMARGGIHDHIGGGFHRYSVDECWHVPHFEKMLYDQGQLANVYLDAFSITKDSFHSSISRDILDYLRRDMIGPSGEIFSAEDADSAESESATRKKEGAFHIWTSAEVEDVVGEHATLFMDHYYIKPSGNCDLSRMSDPHNEFKGKNVLIERNSTSAMASKLDIPTEKYLDVLGICRQKLFDVRSKRPRPHLDDKVIVSWNGLAISSFARASKILKGEPEGTKFNFPVVGCNPKEYMEVAEKAASFIRRQLYNQQTRRLQHSFRNGPAKAPGFLDDYAFLISGLLDLYEFGGAIFWLAWAIELQDIQDELFLDREGGGYFNTPGEDPSVLLRVKEDHDGAEPSGNSVSVINLVRLASMVSGSRSDQYRENAEHLLAVFETRLKEMAMASLKTCWLLPMPHYDPNRTVIHIDPTDTEEIEFWEGNNGNIALMAKNNFSADKLTYLKAQPISSKSSTSPYAFTNSFGLYPETAIYSSTPRQISSRSSSNQDSYTVSYLINSCGLSPETAISASEKVRFETPKKPDSVLKLLRNHGFSETQMANLVRKRPLLLLANAERTLLPKLEFFQSIGVSRTDLAKSLSFDPTILTRSLEKQIIPSYNFLSSVVHSNEKIVAAMKRTSWIFITNCTRDLVPNIAALTELEVPASCIALLVAHFPEALIQRHDQFSETVSQVQKMGFDPSKSTFVLAVHAISGKGNKLIWDRCYDAYRKWGWSKDDILSAFRKHPNCMILSEKKLMRTMDYFVNKMGWESRTISRTPAILFFSLEKRIIPRCSVIQVLTSKGLIKKDFSLNTVLVPAEKCFLKKFVTKYEKEVPQLLRVYQGECDVNHGYHHSIFSAYLFNGTPAGMIYNLTRDADRKV